MNILFENPKMIWSKNFLDVWYDIRNGTVRPATKNIAFSSSNETKEGKDKF